jgi:hypothetical protein
VKRVLNYYMDDSGARQPNRKPAIFRPDQADYFALGGVLIDEADEGRARHLIEDFVTRWGIGSPLHSVEIRNRTGNFRWLEDDAQQRDRFLGDLEGMLTRLPVLGLACVIDRPGYDARYRAKYGRRPWHLCRTAFAISVERAAKHARSMGARLRVLPEKCSKQDDNRLRDYYEALKAQGCPFDIAASGFYRPLQADDFSQTLYELRFKSKTSPMGQIADLFLWPMARAGYDPENRAYRALNGASRLLDAVVCTEARDECGTKYSCFELARASRRAQLG